MKNWRVLVTVLVVLVGAAAVGYWAGRSGKSGNAASPAPNQPATPMAPESPAAAAAATPDAPASDQPPPEPSQEQPVNPSVPAPPQQPAATEAPAAGSAPPGAPAQATVPSVPVSAEAEPATTEVLTSGPVHEAFAEPVDAQPEPGLVAPAAPPADIQETPPADQPVGANIVWVPGYWAWDADRSNYVWVSGCWRAAPPNMQWVPGYWARVPGGWQWVSGYWQQNSVQSAVYVPEAPPAEDMQPVGVAPSDDSIWVPSCPYWYQDSYVLRRGYWLTAHQGWVWVPSHYVWTPRGYIFVDGHWDYPLERRGVLFAPVCFPRDVYGRLGFTYSPAICVDLSLLTNNLFAYPRYCHYYFGDYYDDGYVRLGIYPWCESDSLRKWYDPIYEYDRWRNHRSEPDWDGRQQDEYKQRHDDKSLRPPKTYDDMEARLPKLPEAQRKGFQLAQPLTALVAGKQGPVKFEQVNTAEAREKIAKQATEVHQAQQERERRESPAVGPKIGQLAPKPTEQVAVPQGARGQATAPRAQTVPPPEQKPPVTAPQGAREQASAVPTPTEAVAPPPKPREQTTPAPQPKEPVTAPSKPKQPPPLPVAPPAPKPIRVEPPAPTPPKQPAKAPQPVAPQKPQPKPSAEQVRQEQQARDQQDAADRQNQQREASAEQVRQEQQARDQQEAADRQREQAVRTVPQAVQQPRQVQPQPQPQPQQQDYGRVQDNQPSRSQPAQGGGSSTGSDTQRGRTSGRP